MKLRNSYGSTCLFGELITNKICNQYYIQFKSNSDQSDGYGSFVFGYVESINCIKDFDCGLGVVRNKKHSVGIYTCYSQNQFKLFDKDNTDKKLDYKSKSQFKQDDTFAVLFNFVDNYIQIYHNNNEADKLSLNDKKSIIMAFSLQKENDSIEIIKLEMR